LIVLLASAALWGPGIVNTRGGGDSPFLLQRTHQMVSNLRAGVFPVRWMPDAAYGLGYPFFNHYSALPFYLAGLFHLIGLDLLTALKLTQTLGFVMAGPAMYGWVYHVWRHQAMAWLAAVAYTVAPFHLVNVYVRGDSLSEFYAFIWYPLILWTLDAAVQRASKTSSKATKGRNEGWLWAVVALALSYAGLILSHNLSAAMFGPFALLYLLLLVWYTPGKRWRALGLGLGGVGLGFALAAWTLVPALLETKYVQAETLTQGYFHYSNQFRTTNLVQPSLLFEYDITPTPDGSSPFAMGGLQALLAFLGLIALLGVAYKHGQGPLAEDEERTANEERQAAVRRASNAFLPIGLLLSTLMVTPLSRPFWDHLPLLELVQFPWRFLSVQALFAAAVIGALVLLLREWRAWVAAGMIGALLIASTLLPLHPERLLIGPDDVSATRLQEYELFTSNIGTTIRWEWLPEAAVPRPFTFDTVIEPDAPPRVIPLVGTLAEAEQTLRRSTEQVWRVRVADEGATVAFPLLFWPGWQAWVDGEPAPVWAVEGSGYLALDVPPGEHTIRLQLGRTPLRAAAEILSLVTLLAVLAVTLWRTSHSIASITPRAQSPGGHSLAKDSQFFVPGTRNTRKVLVDIPWQRTARTLCQGRAALIISSVLILLIGLLLLAVRSPSPPNRLDDLTMDFVAMPYLHHNPEGVAFADPESSAVDDQVRLLSYTYSSDQLYPGEMLTVTLNWEGGLPALDDRRVVLRLVSPAEHLPDNGISSYTLAEDSAALTPTTVLYLKAPENTPRGLYLLQLGLGRIDDESTALTPSGAGQGSLYLRPVRVTKGAPLPADAPLLALVGPDIRLHTAEMEQTLGVAGPSTLTVGLEWSSVRPLASNLKVSVRLLDPNGDLRVSTDTQPGYGFSPTSLWRPDERVGDRYVLLLPDDLPADDGYRLVFVFYQATSLAEVARVELGPFALPLGAAVVFEPRPRLFELPMLSRVLDAGFTDPTDSSGGDHIRLAGYDLMVKGESLDLTLWWVAQRQPRVDYTVFAHLFNPTAEADIVAQNDAMPRQGSCPTSGWLEGEVVSDTIRLSLADVPPGAYRLAIGLYDAATGDRLAATAADGKSLPDQRMILPDEIIVNGE
jgi:hypothetical protein